MAAPLPGPSNYEPIYHEGSGLGCMLHNAVEGYFFLEGISKGRCFTELPGDAHELKLLPPSDKINLRTLVKIVSWITVVVPFGMWIAHLFTTPKDKMSYKIIDPQDMSHVPRPLMRPWSQSPHANPMLTVARPHVKPAAPPNYQPNKLTFQELTGEESDKELAAKLESAGPGSCIIKESVTYPGDYSIELFHLPKTRLQASPKQGLKYFGTGDTYRTLAELLDDLKVMSVLLPSGLKEKLEAAKRVEPTSAPDNIRGVKIDSSKPKMTQNCCLIEKSRAFPERQMYLITYYTEKGKPVSRYVELVTTDNRAEIRAKYQELHSAKEAKIDQAGGNVELISAAKREFAEGMKRAGKTQIPGQLKFYEMPEAQSSSLKPSGETYDSVEVFLHRLHDRGPYSLRTCFVSSDVLNELQTKTKALKSQPELDRPIEPPKLAGKDGTAIREFISSYLEPYIRGRVPLEEAQKRTAMMELLTEQFKAFSPTPEELAFLPTLALSIYTDVALLGYYSRVQDPGANIAENSDEFREFVAALKEGVRLDFQAAVRPESAENAAILILEKVNRQRDAGFALVKQEMAKIQEQPGNKQLRG